MLKTLARRAGAALLFGACLAPLGQALAQSGPIRIIVGYPPGGTADAVGRLYADKLREALGSAVVVENQAGAGGQIAAQAFVNAPKDGKTFLLANNHMMSTLPLTVPAVRYDPVKDFQPVGQVASFEHVLVAGPAMPVKTLDEYLKRVSAEPKAGLFGIPAPGSAPHFIGYTLASQNKLPLEAVPYKGGAPLLSDLLGGHVAVAIDALGSLTQYHESGRVAILATTGEKRLAALPNVPTFTELGYPNLKASGWLGLFAPVGTDPQVVERMNAALARIAADPATEAALVPLGFTAASSTPQALADTVAADLALWGPIIKESGYQAQ